MSGVIIAESARLDEEVMKHKLSIRTIVATSLLVATQTSAALALPSRDGRREEPVIRVTVGEMNASNAKISMAYGALVSMWADEFRRIGVRFEAPRVARYEHAVMTSCGIIHANNAEYCPTANTIFYDEVFVAGMAKRAAMSLGTDGDMAAVGIIAHEMGHAVALQLGYGFRSSYENESTADCLAGAFAEQSERDGNLETGDIDEAFFGMSLAGDPVPQPTGDERVDAMIASRIARERHGTKEQRMQNFRRGLMDGSRACIADLG